MPKQEDDNKASAKEIEADIETAHETLSPKEMKQIQEEEILADDEGAPEEISKPDFTHPRQTDSEEPIPKPTFKMNNIGDTVSEHDFDDLTDKPKPLTQPFSTPGANSMSTFSPRLSSTGAPVVRPFGQRVSPQMLSGQKQGKESKLIHLVILILIGAGVIGATVYLLKGGSLGGPAKPAPSTASPVATSPAPSITPVVQIDRSKYQVNVLNGTGKTGLAALVMTRLTALGYKSGKTANATSSAIPQTTVRARPDLATAAAQLVKDLAPDYQAVADLNMKPSDTADLEVVLGLK